MEMVLQIINLAVLVAVFVILFNLRNRMTQDVRINEIDGRLQTLEKFFGENLGRIQTSLGEIKALSKDIGEIREGINKDFQTVINFQMSQFTNNVFNSITQMENRIGSLEKNIVRKSEEMNNTLNTSLFCLQEENRQQLNQIRDVVDEKLQTTLERRISESFKNVSERLEQVQFGLGEMKNLADNVGGLKKIMSGVKTRGILGEVQLESILQEILTPNQYDKNVVTVPNSNCRVEFAVKLPNTGNKDFVYIPIDSKFPLDVYRDLQDAIELGDKDVVSNAHNSLRKAVLLAAKDIKEKYVYPPSTVDFGMMFLPFESLYVEIINSGLLEELQRKYRINVVGPSTMSAFLTSIRMGFQMFNIQKRSDEVWKILATVKTEFGKFEDTMIKMQKHLSQTNSDLETLIGVRTRAIQRKLNDVEGSNGVYFNSKIQEDLPTN